jgi:hypothetical protein
MGCQADSATELLVRIPMILAAIPREALNTVFLKWMQRLQKCIDSDGEYVGWPKQTPNIRSCFIR